jgi:hypothetical protein
MSSRFHNKWHRHNHHTKSTNDPNFPDSAHDPIASPEFPFQGDFVVQGVLSASDDFKVGGDLDFARFGALQTFIAPVTATGEFVRVKVNGQQRLLRLWSQ